MLPIIQKLMDMPLPSDKKLGQGVQELTEIISSPFPGGSMVPNECLIRLDRRLVKGETQKSVLAQLKKVLEKEDCKISFQTHNLKTYTGRLLTKKDFSPAWILSENSAIVRKAQMALIRSGITPQLFTAPYCTNGAVSAGELNIPTILFGPGSIEQAHKVDEYIEVKSVLKAIHAMESLAMELTK
jgi:acetylornithine deacetylase/succinyl-diaminopimelate desuccinylase-like protein